MVRTPDVHMHASVRTLMSSCKFHALVNRMCVQHVHVAGRI